jgi:hypothetical protein
MSWVAFFINRGDPVVETAVYPRLGHYRMDRHCRGRVAEADPQCGQCPSALDPECDERFSRTFQRFYTTCRGVHSVLSARREPVLFVVYLFAQRATTGQAPAVGLPRAVFIRLDGSGITSSPLVGEDIGGGDLWAFPPSAPSPEERRNTLHSKSLEH